MPVIIGSGSASSITTASVDTLIRRMRRLLEEEPWEDTLAGAVSTTSTTAVNLTSASTDWTIGDIAEFDDGSGEQARITKAPPVNAAGDMKRAHNETTATTHASGCVVLKNPRFSYDICSRAITDAVNALWPDAYSALTTTFTPSSTQILYETPSDFMDVISCTQETTATTVLSHVVYGASGSGLPLAVSRGVPTAISSTNVALKLPALDNTTNTILLIYRAKTSTSTIEEGLMSSHLVNAACATIMGAKEVPLGGKDYDVANALEKLHPGDELRSGLWFQQQAEVQRRQLKDDLRRRYAPARRFVS